MVYCKHIAKPYFFHGKVIPFKAADYLIHSAQVPVTKCEATLSQIMECFITGQLFKGQECQWAGLVYLN